MTVLFQRRSSRSVFFYFKKLVVKNLDNVTWQSSL